MTEKALKGKIAKEKPTPKHNTQRGIKSGSAAKLKWSEPELAMSELSAVSHLSSWLPTKFVVCSESLEKWDVS